VLSETVTDNNSAKEVVKSTEGNDAANQLIRTSGSSSRMEGAQTEEETGGDVERTVSTDSISNSRKAAKTALLSRIFSKQQAGK